MRSPQLVTVAIVVGLAFGVTGCARLSTPASDTATLVPAVPSLVTSAAATPSAAAGAAGASGPGAPAAVSSTAPAPGPGAVDAGTLASISSDLGSADTANTQADANSQTGDQAAQSDDGQ